MLWIHSEQREIEDRGIKKLHRAVTVYLDGHRIGMKGSLTPIQEGDR